MAKELAAVRTGQIENAIKVVRGQRVMLDSDLARLYRVTTAALNQAVRRNGARFPPDFAFRVTRQEFTALISQSVTSKTGRGGRRKLPLVFTEHGDVEIMRAFVRLRRLLATPGELVEQITKLAETVQLHDEQIKAIAEVLRDMIEKPAPPKGRIGFQNPPPPKPPSAG